MWPGAGVPRSVVGGPFGAAAHSAGTMRVSGSASDPVVSPAAGGAVPSAPSPSHRRSSVHPSPGTRRGRPAAPSAGGHCFGATPGGASAPAGGGTGPRDSGAAAAGPAIRNGPSGANGGPSPCSRMPPGAYGSGTLVDRGRGVAWRSPTGRGGGVSSAGASDAAAASSPGSGRARRLCRPGSPVPRSAIRRWISCCNQSDSGPPLPSPVLLRLPLRRDDERPGGPGGGAGPGTPSASGPAADGSRGRGGTASGPKTADVSAAPSEPASSSGAPTDGDAAPSVCVLTSGSTPASSPGPAGPSAHECAGG